MDESRHEEQVCFLFGDFHEAQSQAPPRLSGGAAAVVGCGPVRHTAAEPGTCGVRNLRSAELRTRAQSRHHVAGLQGAGAGVEKRTAARQGQRPARALLGRLSETRAHRGARRQPAAGRIAPRPRAGQGASLQPGARAHGGRLPQGLRSLSGSRPRPTGWRQGGARHGPGAVEAAGRSRRADRQGQCRHRRPGGPARQPGHHAQPDRDAGRVRCQRGGGAAVQPVGGAHQRQQRGR